VASVADGRARRAFALLHAVAGVLLISILALQVRQHAPLAILAALHIAISYGFLRAQPWTPWFTGIATALGLVFSSLAMYACLSWLSGSIEAYLILTGLSAYSLFLIISISYAVFKRKDFRP